MSNSGKLPKIGSLLMTEETYDHDDTLLLSNPISHFVVDKLPNYFKFKINFSILYMEIGYLYDMKVLLTDSHGLTIIESSIAGHETKEDDEKVPGFAGHNSFVTLNVENQLLYNSGEHVLTVIVSKQGHESFADSKELIFPVYVKGE